MDVQRILRMVIWLALAGAIVIYGAKFFDAAAKRSGI